MRISCGSIPTNTASKLSAKSLGGNSLMAGKVGACSTMVVTPSSPNAECDRSQGFLLLAVKNTLVRITLRKGNNILCPYGILRINSGCRPSHFPLAKARTGISGGFLTKHRLHSLHKGACSSPVHMRFVTRRLCKSIWTLSPVCNRTVGQDLKTSSDGTSGQVDTYSFGSNSKQTLSSF